MNQLQVFNTDAERSAWIRANATYFTVIRFTGARSPSQYDRKEVPDLETARGVAKGAVNEDPTARCLVYAVAGNQSCYVETHKGTRT
jgi:hypothetical protein